MNKDIFNSIVAIDLFITSYSVFNRKKNKLKTGLVHVEGEYMMNLFLCELQCFYFWNEVNKTNTRTQAFNLFVV